MKGTIHRNYHKLKILKGEARGHTSAIPSKKIYKRKLKHVPSYRV